MVFIWLTWYSFYKNHCYFAKIIALLPCVEKIIGIHLNTKEYPWCRPWAAPVQDHQLRRGSKVKVKRLEQLISPCANLAISAVLKSCDSSEPWSHFERKKWALIMCLSWRVLDRGERIRPSENYFKLGGLIESLIGGFWSFGRLFEMVVLLNTMRFCGAGWWDDGFQRWSCRIDPWWLHTSKLMEARLVHR
jgi:hypothetical protein